MMVNAIHLHLMDLEKKDQIHHSHVQITNLSCVLMENVLEIKIFAELNYLVQIIM